MVRFDTYRPGNFDKLISEHFYVSKNEFSIMFWISPFKYHKSAVFSKDTHEIQKAPIGMWVFSGKSKFFVW